MFVTGMLVIWQSFMLLFKNEQFWSLAAGLFDLLPRLTFSVFLIKKTFRFPMSTLLAASFLKVIT